MIVMGQQRGGIQFLPTCKGKLYMTFYDRELLPRQCPPSWRFSFHMEVGLRGMLFQVLKIILSPFTWCTALNICTFRLTLSKWIWTTAECATSGATYSSLKPLAPARVWTNYVIANICYWPLAFPADSAGAKHLSSFFFLLYFFAYLFFWLQEIIFSTDVVVMPTTSSIKWYKQWRHTM